MADSPADLRVNVVSPVINRSKSARQTALSSSGCVMMRFIRLSLMRSCNDMVSSVKFEYLS
jgi:hypothetical protein